MKRLLCWTSHERASALRAETVHCRSLISHSRRAVSVSCASGLGDLCSWSKKYTPLTFATSGEVTSHTRGSAPFSGLRDTGLRIVSEVRAECGERLCRRQPNAIGGTRDQDLLVVHGTAIQRYGDARVTCPMAKDLTIDHGVSEQGLKTRTGVQVVVKHRHSDRRFQGRGCLRYASKRLRSRAGSNQCAP